MVEFRLFGIPVRVEPMFWLTLGLLGYFWSGNNSGQEQLIAIGLFVLAAFISVLIHELGHALMVKKYRYPTEIVLSSFGGYATHPIGVLTRLQSFLVTLMGPLLQAVFGVTLLLTKQYMNLPDTMIVVFVNYLIGVSIVWAILNCVPVIPLDGGRMLEAALGPRRIQLTLLISLSSAVVLCILAFKFGLVVGGFFMAMFAWQNYQMYEHYRRR